MREKAAKAQPRVREAAPNEIRKPSETDLQRWDRGAAYYRARAASFQPGEETQDWLTAEADIRRGRQGRGMLSTSRLAFVVLRCAATRFFFECGRASIDSLAENCCYR